MVSRTLVGLTLVLIIIGLIALGSAGQGRRPVYKQKGRTITEEEAFKYKVKGRSGGGPGVCKCVSSGQMCGYISGPPCACDTIYQCGGPGQPATKVKDCPSNGRAMGQSCATMGTTTKCFE